MKHYVYIMLLISSVVLFKNIQSAKAVLQRLENSKKKKGYLILCVLVAVQLLCVLMLLKNI